MVRQDVMKAAMAMVLGLAAQPARAQLYDSGSDGSLLDLAPPSTPTSVTVTVPPSGVLNYANVNIPAGVTVTFTRPPNNTPIWLLATGDIIINGIINVSGADGATGAPYTTITGVGGVAGPAGGRGGHDWSGNGSGQWGGGPAGGKQILNNNLGSGGASLVSPGGTTQGAAALPLGAPDWLALFGGSGGGSTQYSVGNTAAGGGGGGVLVISSSHTITLNGQVLAKGGNGTGYSGGGGGGVIRLAAEIITIGNSALLDTRGGYCVNTTGDARLWGGAGLVRLDAFTINGNVAGKSFPNPYVVNPPQPALPPFGIAALPKLTITHVQGQVPAGTLDAFPPNATISTGVAITIEVTANNVPLGTTATVQVRPIGFNPVTATTTGFAGTTATSVATATVTIPNGSRVGGVDAWIPSLTVP